MFESFTQRTLYRSLEEMIAYAAEEKELEPEAALKLHAYMKSKAVSSEDKPPLFDPAYQNHNQASHCWDRYNQYLQCLKDNDGNDSACSQAKYLANALCPTLWLDKWKEQREEGTFPGVQAPIVGGDDDDDE